MPIVLGTAVPVHSNQMPELLTFACEFCTVSRVPKHNIAVALSSFWFCINGAGFNGDIERIDVAENHMIASPVTKHSFKAFF